MFLSQEYLDNKTGRDDPNRFQYLQALVTEFQDTSSDGIFNLIPHILNVVRVMTYSLAYFV